MSELFTNLARSTLASGITAGALSLTVQSGDGNDLFPVLGGSDNFRCVLFKKSTGDIEIINVTARAGDVFTIARAQEQIGNLAATAFAFDAGDLIELRPTGAFYNALSVGASSTNIQSGIFLTGLDTGAADVYTVAMNPTATTLSVSQEVRIQIGAGNTNTGIAATLQLDAIAAKPIKMKDGSNPRSGSLAAGKIYSFVYDGTNFVYEDAATISGTETLTNKTHTNPILNGTLAGTAVGRGALAYETGVQSISSGVATAITFNSESYDTDSLHNTAINPSRMTVPAGITKVKLKGRALFAANATGYRGIVLYKNSSPSFAGQPSISLLNVGAGSSVEAVMASPMLEVVAGDYFEMRAYQTSGGALNVTGSGSGNNLWFSMELIK